MTTERRSPGQIPALYGDSVSVSKTTDGHLALRTYSPREPFATVTFLEPDAVVALRTALLLASGEEE